MLDDNELFAGFRSLGALGYTCDIVLFLPQEVGRGGIGFSVKK
jgi:hypothetical protein